MSGREDPDLYLTPKTEGRSEIRIKSSRFLGFAAETADEMTAETFVRRLEKIHHDAAHVCWAYRIGPEAPVTARYSDAGEPSGTAGRPIEDAIEGLKLFRTVCVVVRYFGGIKLGTGGLSRAYAVCSSAALHAAGVEERHLTSDLRVTFEYGLTGTVMAQVSGVHGEIVRSDYGNGTILDIRVRRSLVDTLSRRILDTTSGRVRCELLQKSG
jgi:uncharacterized YigZ family protein